jgi:hypothetical protein
LQGFGFVTEFARRALITTSTTVFEGTECFFRPGYTASLTTE